MTDLGDIAAGDALHDAAPDKPRPSPGDVAPEHYRFDLHPGYRAAKAIEAELFSGHVANPYFRVIDEVAGATIKIGSRTFINYANYNYLGLSGDPRVSAAAIAAIERYGTSVSASRLVAGERPFHRALESEIADFLGVEDAVAFVSGHATNVTVIGHLFGRKDLVLHDSLIHNSVLQGCLLSGAKRITFPHNDWAALDRILASVRRDFEKVLIVVEGVYSMDGDIPDLPRFVEIRNRYKAILMVDEAHSLGVVGKTGRGLSEHFGVPATDVDIWMGTLSKALASCGGYVGGCQALVTYLRYTAPGFLFSVGLSPPDAASSLAALGIMRDEPQRVADLQARARLFLDSAKRAGLKTGRSQGSAVVPIVVGDSRRALLLSQRLFDHGIFALPIVHPAVPSSQARVRFFLTSLHTPDQIEFTIRTLTEAISACSEFGPTAET